MPLTRSEKVFTMLGVLLGLLLAALDNTIVATAGPAIQADLHIPASLYPWLTTSYMVASTVMVPIYGKLSDLYGRRALLVVAIVIFLAGSILCGLSQSTLQLILFRALQGTGSAGLFTSAFAIVADIFPPAERGKYQGVLGSAFAFSSVVGPLVGGVITDTIGWHWVFFVNAPVGAIALAFIFTKMPPLKQPAPARPRIDFAGAFALIVAVVPLLLALSLGRRELQADDTGFLWSSWQILSLFALAIVGTLAFLWIERRASEPLLDLSLFRNRTFAVSNAASFVVGATFFCSIVFLPLFMVNVVGLSATNSGLTLMPLTMGIVAGNIASGQIVSWLGRYRSLMLVSMTLNVIGFAIMAFTLGLDSSQLSVTAKMVLLGIGLGPSIPMFALIIQNAVEPRSVGVATSAVTFFRSLGATVGLAVFGTIFGAVLASGLAERMPEATAGLPPALREQLGRPGAAMAAVGGEGEGVGEMFPAERIKAHVRGELRKNGAPSDATVEAAAVAAVDRMQLAVRSSFVESIQAIYLVAIALAVLALLLTLLLPDIPLSREQKQHVQPAPD